MICINWILRSRLRRLPLGRQDRGKTREYVFEAVQHHLNLAKKAVEDSGIKSNYCEQALGNIATAQAELNAARTAPVKK